MPKGFLADRGVPTYSRGGREAANAPLRMMPVERAWGKVMPDHGGMLVAQWR
jgi:hypothetical protein